MTKTLKVDDWEAANRRGRKLAATAVSEWRGGRCSPNRLRFTAESLKDGEAAGYWQAIAEAVL